MAALTNIDICAQALILLGEVPISSFEDDTDAARICSNMYPTFKNSLVSMYKWRITMKKRQLSRLTDPPLNEWDFRYQLPSDMFALKAVQDSLEVPAREVTEFEIFGRELHTNEQIIVLEYQVEKDEADWPPYLVQLAKLAFAAEIAPAVTDQVNAAEVWLVRAWGLPQERMQGGFYAIAKTIDAQGAATQVIDDYSLIDVRN